MNDSEPTRQELEERIDELEQQLAEFRSLFEIPGDDGARIIEEFRVGGLPIGKAITSKTSETDVERIAEEVVIDGADTNVSVGVDREEMRPIHDMATDLRLGNDERIPTVSARRAARLFQEFWRTAKGDTDGRVDPTGQAYTLNSGHAAQILQSEEDIADSSVSKVVSRVFEALQRHSKAFDCQCDTISGCNHGLIVFDDTSGTNRVKAEKSRFHDYQQEIAATASDDEGEQPSEDITTAEAEAQAAEDRLDQLQRAQTDGGSDTVVRRSNGSVSEHDSTDSNLTK